MEMSVTSGACPSAATMWIVLLCVFWPFIAASFLSRRGTSAGPIFAVLVPLALSVAGMALDLARTLQGLAISESAPGGAAAAAGIAEALASPGIGVFFAVPVLIAAAIRLHRPFVDRFAASIFLLLVAETIGALLTASSITNDMWRFYAWLTGAGIAAVVALIAAFWTFRTGRGRATSRPLPYGIPIVLVTCAILGVVVWQSAHQYMAIAMGR